jgi:hypothetical protein
VVNANINKSANVRYSTSGFNPAMSSACTCLFPWPRCVRSIASRTRRGAHAALVWAEEGLEAVRKVAKKSPEAFVAIAARICPNDVRLTLEQAIPGGMSLADYSLMREVIAAIREGLPEADQLQPGQVFQHVLGALRDCPNKDQNTNSSICSGQIRE